MVFSLPSSASPDLTLFRLIVFILFHLIKDPTKFCVLINFLMQLSFYLNMSAVIRHRKLYVILPFSLEKLEGITCIN